MEYKVLKQYAEACQTEADIMAFKLLNQQELFSAISIVQSVCDFNLAWLYSISPGVVIHEYSINFISKNIKHFKRKLKISEIIKFDGIIFHNKPKDFKEFKEMFRK